MASIKNRIILLLISVAIGLCIKHYRRHLGPLPVPEVNLTKNWGPGDAKPDDQTIVPFKIDFPQEKIEKLKQQLSTQLDGLAPPLEGAKFEYGMNPKKLISIVNFWKDSYLNKFGDRLKYMNQFCQFKTQIQGLNIHFVHVKPKNPEGKKVVPILLLHGWPGSFLEFYEMIPLMTETGTDRVVFECIIPSLPGFGFSDATTKQGLGCCETAVIFKNLMARLGFDEFYVQGGDWGSSIARTMATFFPQNIIGFHSNWLKIMTSLGFIKSSIASLYPTWFIEEEFVDWYFPLMPTYMMIIKESGYFHLQATKPDTIGAALTYNPVGLAAYILEKFSHWTNPSYTGLEDGGLDKYFTQEHLLDNLMIYYMTNSITTSVRFYKELFGDQLCPGVDRMEVKIPVGISRFRYEASHQLDWVLKDKYTNILHTRHHSDGGHFAAKQYPELLFNDVAEFVDRVEILYKNEK